MVYMVKELLLVAVCMQQHVYVHVSMLAWLEDMRPPLRLDPLQGADLMLTPACKASKAVLVEMLPTFEAAGDMGALGRIAGGDALRLDLKGKHRPTATYAARLTPQTTSHTQVGPEDCIICWRHQVVLMLLLPMPTELIVALCACRLHLQHANV